MAVPEEYVDVPFRQQSAVLRWAKDKRPSLTHTRSERPTTNTGEYTDTEKPTIVKFAADDRVNVLALLAAGAIVPHGVMATRKVAAAEAAAEREPPAPDQPKVPEGGA